MPSAARVRVELPGPLDVAASLELFRRSGDDFLDRWDGQRLVRAVQVIDGSWVPFVAINVGSVEAPALDVVVQDAAHLDAIRAVAARMFVPEPSGYARLVQADPVLAALSGRYPAIRQIRQLDLFTALVRAISAQQVNLRWAVTTRRRLAEAFGQLHSVAGETVYSLDPAHIAQVDPTEIRALQFTTSKSVSIVAVAQTLAAENLSVDTLAELSDDAVIETLTRIRGIGRWSAEWVIARTLGRPRVVAGDLGVRKAVGLAYLGTPLPSEAEVRAATAHWGESASVAQAVLLHALGEGALTPQKPTASPKPKPTALPAPPGSRAGRRP